MYTEWAIDQFSDSAVYYIWKYLNSEYWWSFWVCCDIRTCLTILKEFGTFRNVFCDWLSLSYSILAFKYIKLDLAVWTFFDHYLRHIARSYLRPSRVNAIPNILQQQLFVFLLLKYWWLQNSMSCSISHCHLCLLLGMPHQLKDLLTGGRACVKTRDNV